jgi:signal transduction histidine kinase
MACIVVEAVEPIPAPSGGPRSVAEALGLLAEAGSLLAASLDFDATLRSVARLVVPRLADWCLIDVIADDGQIRRVATVHADPVKEALAHELRSRFPVLAPDTEHTLTHAIETGESFLDTQVDPERLAREARNAEHFRLIEALGYRAEMVVPLIARDRALGTITFVSTTAPRFGPDDLALAEELAHRAALALDNARLYRQAQDALQTRDYFMALAAHDLRSPLTAIRGYAQLLDRQIERGLDDPDSTRDGLAHIQRSAMRMAALIDELVDVARLQMGQPLELKLTPVDLVALVRVAVRERADAVGLHRLRFEADEPIVGLWDAPRLARVVDNLLDNAIKYSLEGGEVIASLGVDGDVAVLLVSDEGIGIPAADLSQVFEQFHRGANAAGHIAGTGLGLFGVRQIVEAHGGTIEVESEEGRGSTFTVRLPRGG